MAAAGPCSQRLPPLVSPPRSHTVTRRARLLVMAAAEAAQVPAAQRGTARRPPPAAAVLAGKGSNSPRGPLGLLHLPRSRAACRSGPSCNGWARASTRQASLCLLGWHGWAAAAAAPRCSVHCRCRCRSRTSPGRRRRTAAAPTRAARLCTCTPPQRHRSPSSRRRLTCGARPALPQSERQLALPHLAVGDLRWVDWAALHAAGFRGCVFDKDNTLTGRFLLA